MSSTSDMPVVVSESDLKNLENDYEPPAPDAPPPSPDMNSVGFSDPFEKPSVNYDKNYKESEGESGKVGEESEGKVRSFQMILYGATGFTGGLAVKYLKNYPEVRVALAGRNSKKLGELQAEFGFDTIECDSSSYEECEQLVRFLEPGGVLLSTAGPFALCGENLVRACAENGKKYFDSDGETGWCREMIEKYHNTAVKTGAIIGFQFCHDISPYSLIAHKLSREINEKGEEVVKYENYIDILSRPSNGTVKTAMLIRNNKESKKSKLDPLLIGGNSEYVTQNKNVKGFSFSKRPDICSYLTPFFMASVDCAGYKRSNAILHYGKNVKYVEGEAFVSIIDVFWHYWLQVWRYFLIIAGLYKNPTVSEMEKGYLDIIGVATGSDGSVSKGMFSVKFEPGYKCTSEMLCEAALAVILNSNELNEHRGMVTPAIFNDKTDVYLKRLLNNPTKSFEFRVKNTENEKMKFTRKSNSFTFLLFFVMIFGLASSMLCKSCPFY